MPPGSNSSADSPLVAHSRSIYSIRGLRLTFPASVLPANDVKIQGIKGVTIWQFQRRSFILPKTIFRRA
jgi:hypothetical protein